MKFMLGFFGTLLAAASLALAGPDPRGAASFLLQFSLDETPAAVAARMGPPRVTTDYQGFRSLQYQIDTLDNHDFSHAFVFDSAGRLLSVTRNAEEPEEVDALLPLKETRTHYWPNADKPEYRVRVRTLPDGRYLIAMGVEKPGQKTTQLVLARREALEAFFPWVAEALRSRYPGVTGVPAALETGK